MCLHYNRKKQIMKGIFEKISVFGRFYSYNVDEYRLKKQNSYDQRHMTYELPDNVKYNLIIR